MTAPRCFACGAEILVGYDANGKRMGLNPGRAPDDATFVYVIEPGTRSIRPPQPLFDPLTLIKHQRHADTCPAGGEFR